MQQDQQLKSLFKRFDSGLEETPPPLQDPRFNKPIHRFRSPWAKFLEWMINGGASMFLVSLLVSLSGIFWNGLSFGWVAVPLVVFLLRPLMGETPVKNSVRMMLILLLGAVLSMTLAVLIDFSVYSPTTINNPYFLCFLVENSLLALLIPAYGLTIAAAIILVTLLSLYVAKRNPWLDRKVRLSPWRRRLTALSLTTTAFLSGYIVYQSDYEPAWYLVLEARRNPQMEAVSQGANLSVGRALDWSAPSQDQLLIRTQELVTKLRERKEPVTQADLEDATKLLKSEGLHSYNLLYADLWWELHCFAQDYSVGDEVPHLDDLVEQIPLRLFLAQSIKQEEMEIWYSKLSARPIRTFYKSNEVLEDIVAVQAYLDACGKLTGEQGLERFLTEVENRYFLQKYVHGQKLPSVYDLAIFNSRDTGKRYRDFDKDATHRFHADSKRSVLSGVLEARIHKSVQGRYPDNLKSTLHGSEYRKTDHSAEFIRYRWDNKEELICRLPR